MNAVLERLSLYFTAPVDQSVTDRALLKPFTGVRIVNARYLFRSFDRQVTAL